MIELQCPYCKEHHEIPEDCDGAWEQAAQVLAKACEITEGGE